MQKVQCVSLINIHGRSQTSYTAPCNGVVSHGAQIGDLWVFADHTRKKTNTKQMHPRSLRAERRFTPVNLHAQTAVDAGGIPGVAYAPDES